MFDNDQNFNLAEKLIKNYMAKLTQNPVLVHDDELIHETLEAAAVVLPYFRMMGADSVQQVLYDEYPQVGFTFNTFYNETASFILDGKRRTVSTGQWSVLLVSYMNDIHSTKQVERTGSLAHDFLLRLTAVVGKFAKWELRIRRTRLTGVYYLMQTTNCWHVG
ncbi:hypothetical protein SEGD1_054 [Enterobacteria phage SEGD1]|uniref:Uncharacterized protein n=1 Tax=Enterobacteria phage SEGD1 TaxID=1805456 RepID=A0A142IIB5_9CAUD|nr:hypothetical protein SEGD1_054 [Enterobacteria phage SEGD1]